MRTVRMMIFRMVAESSTIISVRPMAMPHFLFRADGSGDPIRLGMRPSLRFLYL